MLFIFSIISGNGFETNSIVLISFMALYFIKKYFFEKEHLSIYQITIFIGTLIGFMTNLLSPGNAVRMESMNNGETLFSKIFDGLGLWFYNGIINTFLFIIIPIFLLIFVVYVNRNKIDNKYCKCLNTLAISFIVGLFSFLVISYHRTRDVFLNFYWNNLIRCDVIIVFIFFILLVFYFIIFFKDKIIVTNDKIKDFNYIYLYFISAMVGVASYIVTPAAWCRSYMFMVIFIIIALCLMLKEFSIKYNIISKVFCGLLIFSFACSYYVSFSDIYKTYKEMNIVDDQIKYQIKNNNKIIYVKSVSSSNQHNSASIEKWVIPPIIYDENVVTENGIHKDYEWINIELTKYYFNDVDAWNNGYRIIGIE